MQAIIIGGGIGGLTTAIALRQVGIEAKVYERAPQLLEVGAGLTLWSNAIKALGRLGLEEAVLSLGTRGRDGGVRSWQGTLLIQGSLDALDQKYGAANICVHRAELQALLLRHAGEDTVQLGAECVRVEQSADHVSAHFSDGRRVQGDVLIGADGLHSVIRAALHGAQPPRYAGYTTWRGVTPFDPAQLVVGETWGCGARFGLVPISQSRVYWFATANTPQGTPDPAEGRKARLLQRFRGWHAPIEALIAATDEGAILHNDIYDRDPLSHWGQGRITLLGDAAHPTTPNLGQGACQAIEDAVMLAATLKKSLHAGPPQDVAAALRAYEAQRIPRTSTIVRLSRRIGAMGQLDQALLCRVRDMVIRAIPSGLQQRQFDWLLGYEVV